MRHAAARVRKRAREYDLKRPESLHKIRIAAKKERYAREFFEALSHGKGEKRRHDLIAGMQDELGELNDSFVARELLAESAAGPGPVGVMLHHEVMSSDDRADLADLLDLVAGHPAAATDHLDRLALTQVR